MSLEMAFKSLSEPADVVQASTVICKSKSKLVLSYREITILYHGGLENKRPRPLVLKKVTTIFSCITSSLQLYNKKFGKYSIFLLILSLRKTSFRGNYTRKYG